MLISLIFLAWNYHVYLAIKPPNYRYSQCWHALGADCFRNLKLRIFPLRYSLCTWHCSLWRDQWALSDRIVFCIVCRKVEKFVWVFNLSYLPWSYTFVVYLLPIILPWIENRAVLHKSFVFVGISLIFNLFWSQNCRRTFFAFHMFLRPKMRPKNEVHPLSRTQGLCPSYGPVRKQQTAL